MANARKASRSWYLGLFNLFVGGYRPRFSVDVHYTQRLEVTSLQFLQGDVGNLVSAWIDLVGAQVLSNVLFALFPNSVYCILFVREGNGIYLLSLIVGYR